MGKVIHRCVLKTGPYCGDLQDGDGTTGLWTRTTCPKCHAKRPTESQRVRAYQRKKKIQKGLDV